MWKIFRDDETVFRYGDTNTGEIREYRGGFNALIRELDQLQATCWRIADYLAVAEEWENDQVDLVDAIKGALAEQ